MKNKWTKCVFLALSVICLFHVPVLPVYAEESQGTDGTEMQVIEPEQLEIQLGPNWAGVEFQLKTDAGMYPGTIPVGDDGVLRLEIGGSKSYILTCMNSALQAAEPERLSAADEGAEYQTEQTASEEPAGALDTVQQTESENPAADMAAELQTGSAEPAELLAPDEPEEQALPVEGSIPAEENQSNTVAGIPVLHLVLFCGGMVVAIGSLILMYVLKKRREATSDDDEEYDDE